MSEHMFGDLTPPAWLRNWATLEGFTIVVNHKEHNWDLINRRTRVAYHCFPTWTMEIFLRSLNVYPLLQPSPTAQAKTLRGQDNVPAAFAAEFAHIKRF